MNDTLSDRVCVDLRAAGGVDIILMQMHSAMIAEQAVYCEGDVIGSLREIAGPRVMIGAEFDPHCHLIDKILDVAGIIVLYKE